MNVKFRIMRNISFIIISIILIRYRNQFLKYSSLTMKRFLYMT